MRPRGAGRVPRDAPVALACSGVTPAAPPPAPAGDVPPGPPSLTVRVQTRFADLDPLGHVNHVQFLVFMETARVRFMHRYAGPLRGHVLVARTECDHLHEIPASTREVDVTVRVERVGRTSFTVRHEITDAGRTVAVGHVVLVAVDAQHRPRPVTDGERARLLGDEGPDVRG